MPNSPSSAEDEALQRVEAACNSTGAATPVVITPSPFPPPSRLPSSSSGSGRPTRVCQSAALSPGLFEVGSWGCVGCYFVW